MFFLFSLIKCCLDLFDQSPLKGLLLVQMFPMITAVFNPKHMLFCVK